MQIFSVPVSLPCSHTFCYECILKLFSPPTGKGSDKTYFQVEKCPLCRAPIRLELAPSLNLRNMSDTICDQERRQKIANDLIKLKKHSGCIRLGAHCSGKMCLRPKAVVPTKPVPVPHTPSIRSILPSPITQPNSFSSAAEF